MSINKNIKAKKSLLYTYFNDTYTGEKILCVGTFLICAFCLFVFPALIGFLADRFTFLEAKVLIGVKRADYLDYYALGGVILICLGLISLIIIAPIEFFKNVANDIKLAKIKQFLPVTKEEWEVIGIKTQEDIFDNLKCIFAENKRLDLYDNGDHELSPKVKDNVLDSVIAGYSFLWRSIENTLMSEDNFDKEKLKDKKSIYINFKVFTSDDINRLKKRNYLEHIMFYLDSNNFEEEGNCVIEAAEKEFDELFK